VSFDHRADVDQLEDTWVILKVMPVFPARAYGRRSLIRARHALAEVNRATPTSRLAGPLSRR
jgi:hypothetical protein